MGSFPMANITRSRLEGHRRGLPNLMTERSVAAGALYLMVRDMVLV